MKNFISISKYLYQNENKCSVNERRKFIHFRV